MTRGLRRGAARRRSHDVARGAGIALRQGVYAGLLGPSYETPAEVRMVRLLGAQAVGNEHGPRGHRAPAHGGARRRAVVHHEPRRGHRAAPARITPRSRPRRVPGATSSSTLLRGLDCPRGERRREARDVDGRPAAAAASAARAAASAAYAPYSRYRVGAALLTRGGRRVRGVQRRERDLRGDDVRRAQRPSPRWWRRATATRWPASW